MGSETQGGRGVRGPYRNGVVRRRQIVMAAALAFGQYGYHGASLRQIADQVGTTNATLIAYFGSKEGLLVAVLEHWREETAPETDIFHGLDYFRSFAFLMRYHAKRRGLIELFLTMSIEAAQHDHPARPFILERQLAGISVMVENLRFAVEQRQIEPMSPETMDAEARLMIATFDGLEIQWMQTDELDLEAMVRRHVDSAIARWTARPIEDVRRETDEWLATHQRDGSVELSNSP
ncbi:TetR/AcrR family transcriptional regulator [Microbacterium sp. DT81.1]|uniref:TetR/AcrR family transcriptional regulator n=1 Tax=Microbacterium sp. DT81.1 TaxID=3393413 RepID=UPI003CFAE2CD